MDYVFLGTSELRVSQLGFGCCPMGKHGWGNVFTGELMDAVSVALDNGVNFFDTADVYGFGESERILGRSLKGQRDKAIIATKFGVKKDDQGRTVYDNSPEWINLALDESLKRLDVDCIDLYQLHYRDDKMPIDDVIATLEKKRVDGKIRYYGLSNVSAEDISGYALPEAMISFQAEYSLANRSHEEEIVNIVRENDLGFLSWGSLGQGVLSGKYDIGTSFPEEDRRSRSVYVNFYGEKLKKNMMIIEEMKRVSWYTKRTLPQIAVRWILDYLGFGVVLVGIKRPEHILENVEAFGWHLTQANIDSLDAVSCSENESLKAL